MTPEGGRSWTCKPRAPAPQTACPRGGRGRRAYPHQRARIMRGPRPGLAHDNEPEQYGGCPPMTRALPRTPAMLPAQEGQSDRPRQQDPPAPGPLATPPEERLTGRPAPPPRRAGPPAAGRTRRPGLPHDPDRTHTPGEDAPATKGGLQAVPPREGGGEPQRDPPPIPPPPPATGKPRGRRPPPLPRQGRWSPLPPAGPRPAGRQEQGPRPRPSRLLPQEPRWTNEPTPTHQGATRTAPKDSKRARTRAVWGPRPPWPERRPEHPLCCLPREGRGTDRGKAIPSPTGSPGRTDRGNGTQAAPPPPSHHPALERPRRARPPHGEHTALKPGRGETGPGRPPPPENKLNGARDRGGMRGRARTE